MWIHCLYDNDWSINSYKKLTNFTNLEDACIFLENVDTNLLEKSMIFLMKENNMYYSGIKHLIRK